MIANSFADRIVHNAYRNRKASPEVRWRAKCRRRFLQPDRARAGLGGRRPEHITPIPSSSALGTGRRSPSVLRSSGSGVPARCGPPRRATLRNPGDPPGTARGPRCRPAPPALPPAPEPGRREDAIRHREETGRAGRGRGTELSRQSRAVEAETVRIGPHEAAPEGRARPGVETPLLHRQKQGFANPQIPREVAGLEAERKPRRGVRIVRQGRSRLRQRFRLPQCRRPRRSAAGHAVDARLYRPARAGLKAGRLVSAT